MSQRDRAQADADDVGGHAVCRPEERDQREQSCLPRTFLFCRSSRHPVRSSPRVSLRSKLADVFFKAAARRVAAGFAGLGTSGPRPARGPKALLVSKPDLLAPGATVP